MNQKSSQCRGETRFHCCLALFVIGQLSANAAPIETSGSSGDNKQAGKANPLKPPAQGQIPVAFVISEGAVIIDFCGPWEVFRDVNIPGLQDGPFRLYTVSDTTSPIHAGGGMQIIPDYTFANAPAPKVIVIPAQSKPSEAMLKWIRESTKNTDVTMSVCAGAFVLARTGLLSGKSATTFHAAFVPLRCSSQYSPQARCCFVEDGNLASAGGLSSGIDLALRVVERYYGRDAPELQHGISGTRLDEPGFKSGHASAPVSTAEHPLCPVCGMDVDPATAPKSVFKGKTYYFCSVDDKKTFEAAPDKFADATQTR